MFYYVLIKAFAFFNYLFCTLLVKWHKNLNFHYKYQAKYFL